MFDNWKEKAVWTASAINLVVCARRIKEWIMNVIDGGDIVNLFVSTVSAPNLDWSQTVFPYLIAVSIATGITLLSLWRDRYG